MDTERIRTLLCAVDEGSLTAVSEKMGYTASGISRMMATLEAEAGFPLLVRSRSGVVPTEECRQLLPLMKEILALADRFHQASGELAGLARGTIRIGTSYYAYYSWFAKLIADFQQTYRAQQWLMQMSLHASLHRLMESRIEGFYGAHQILPRILLQLRLTYSSLAEMRYDAFGIVCRPVHQGYLRQFPVYLLPLPQFRRAFLQFPVLADDFLHELLPPVVIESHQPQYDA